MTKNIGFIGGGQMAEAVIKGLAESKQFADCPITVLEPLEARQNYLERTYQTVTVHDTKSLCRAVDTIVLAVKPQVMASVLEDLQPHLDLQLMITVAAGLPISFYEHQLAAKHLRLIRAMPNMPALIQEGATALCSNEHVSEADFTTVTALFDTIGITVPVQEYLMDAVTGLSGSGPAFVFSFIEAMIDGGVKAGLGRDAARQLTLQTISGAVQLTKQSDAHPAVLRDKVTSPGGTTASGLHTLETNGFNGIILSAIEASCTRSRELGKRS